MRRRRKNKLFFDEVSEVTPSARSAIRRALMNSRRALMNSGTGFRGYKIMSRGRYLQGSENKTFKKLMNRMNKMAPETSPADPSDLSTIGFGVKKILNKQSVFYGLPSLRSIVSYVEATMDYLHLLPSKDDSLIVARIKLMTLIWRGMRVIRSTQSFAVPLHNRGFVEIDFGASKNIISELVEEIADPDEVFPPVQSGFSFYLFRYPLGEGYMYWVGTPEVIQKVYITPNNTKDDILELIWSKLGRVIQLESENGDLRYVSTELTKKNIFGSSTQIIEKLKEDYRYFRDKKMSRGYLLIGRPGTGKTGIINSIVESAEGRIFIINGLDSPMSILEMTSLFVQMKPSFIIFDDCDRSSNSPDFIKATLLMLETVKEHNPCTNFLFTANSFTGILYDEAVTRKGRVDQIYEIPEPNEDDRLEIFKGYAEEMGLELPNDDLLRCVDLSKGLTGADIKELCIQLQRSTIDGVFERVSEVSLLKVKYRGDDPKAELLSKIMAAARGQ